MKLDILDLHVEVAGKEVIKGLNLSVAQGEVHALMGPNGSGKSTLAHTVMGHPKYKVTRGDIFLDGESILGLTPDQRAKRGLFLAFQYPYEVSGITVTTFLKAAYTALRNGGEKEKQSMISYLEFRKLLREKLKALKIEETFADRYLNEGFSGGEKKKCEILQMAVLKPKIALLDETDSGLDVDALKIVAEGVNSLLGPDLGVLLITHYHRILNYIKPRYVHVMMDGRIVKSGGEELAYLLEEKGYDWLKEAVSSSQQT